jgi:MtN3 and saliva related transmembrane protein
MPSTQQVIGIAAGICTGISLLPQLIKIIREKKVEDISYVMLIILMTGLAGWVWYGILLGDYPIIITNSFSILVNLVILILRFKYRER